MRKYRTTFNYPQVLHAFNAYKRGNALVGISGDVELPDLNHMTETLSGPGILGEIDAIVLGFFEHLQVKVPFAVMYDDYFGLLAFDEDGELTLRGSIQTEDRRNGRTREVPVRVVFRGKSQSAELGKWAQGAKNESAITIGLSYLKIEVDGEERIELDKYAFIFRVNGKDLLADVRRNI